MTLNKVKNLKCFIILVFIINTFNLKADAPIPLEIMQGDKSTWFQMVMNRNIGDTKFSVFNLTNYEVQLDKNIPNYFINQTVFNYSITNNFVVGLGANIKSSFGFRSLASMCYSKFGKDYGFLIQPTYEIAKNWEGEYGFFGLIEKSIGEGEYKFYMNLQVLNMWIKNNHSYTFHNYRIGLKYKVFHIGPSINIQHFGKDGDTVLNTGGFVKILL